MVWSGISIDVSTETVYIERVTFDVFRYIDEILQELVVIYTVY